MTDCIFCKIAQKEIPTELLYEDEDVIAFNDIAPKSPVHILIVPKKHIDSVNNLEEENKELLGKLVLVAKVRFTGICTSSGKVRRN